MWRDFRTMKYLRFLLTVLVVAFIFGSSSAYAACSGPAGDAGKIVYNDDHNVMQFCNGTDWVSMVGGVAPSVFPTCPYKATLVSLGGNWLCSTDPAFLTSCKAILDAGLSTGDGNYSMMWNGVTQTMYCDMTTSGGGWTRVVDIPGPINVSYNTVTTNLSTAQRNELARLDEFTSVLTKANTNLTGNVCGYGHSTQLSGLLYNGSNVSISYSDYLIELFGGQTSSPDNASASVVTAVSSLSTTRKNYFKTATSIRHNMHCWSGGGACRQNCKSGSVSNMQIFYR